MGVMDPLLMATNALVVVWIWRIVCPHALRTLHMKWQVLLCFVPLMPPMIIRALNSPISVKDQYNGRASSAFKNWTAVLQVVGVLVMWMVLPALYFISVRTNNRFRFSKKMWSVFVVALFGGSIAYVLTFFGDSTTLPIVIVLVMSSWMVVLLMERRKVASHKKDFSSIAVLSFMVTAIPVGFGVAIVTISDGLSENSSLQLLVCLFWFCACSVNQLIGD